MFTFTKDELRQLLSDAITDFAGKGTMDFVEEYRQNRASTVERIMAQLEASQPQRDTRLESSLPAIDEDEIFTDALKSDPPIFCPDCGDELSSIETGDKIWCMRCGYTSNDSLDNISPAELGLQPVA